MFWESLKLGLIKINSFPQNLNIYITGYQKFHGTEGHTLKSGCGFYIKEGIRFTPRKDLDISFADDKNEYQSCWIKLLLDKQPNILRNFL